MARAWAIPVRAGLVDRGARSTLGNALAVGRAARRVRADDVLVVTSTWHGRRAALLARAALRGTGTTIRVATTGKGATPARRARELVAWVFVPVLVIVAARTR